MELEGHWWKGQLAADIYQALRYRVSRIPNFLMVYYRNRQISIYFYTGHHSKPLNTDISH